MVVPITGWNRRKETGADEEGQAGSERRAEGSDPPEQGDTQDDVRNQLQGRLPSLDVRTADPLADKRHGIARGVDEVAAGEEHEYGSGKGVGAADPGRDHIFCEDRRQDKGRKSNE